MQLRQVSQVCFMFTWYGKGKMTNTRHDFKRWSMLYTLCSFLISFDCVKQSCYICLTCYIYLRVYQCMTHCMKNSHKVTRECIRFGIFHSMTKKSFTVSVQNLFNFILYWLTSNENCKQVSTTRVYSLQENQCHFY